ncbi:Fumarate hydratase class I, anaerobic [Escherichia coli]|uniref:Fumarate hydratase class I, anaerobic n=1 Tax=Escherichia coli TaxID=562 RepID=A0A3P5DIQ0_ECOLX|nr:Fumarate hydratase class I, anaerobic [Escherichia coli]
MPLRAARDYAARHFRITNTELQAGSYVKQTLYLPPFPMGKDNTEYYLLTDYVSVADFDGETILKVEPEALTLLAQQAFHDASFMLRPAHQKQVAAILHDPEASENDKYVALQFLRNSEIAAKGVLPTCRYRHRDHRR